MHNSFPVINKGDIIEVIAPSSLPLGYKDINLIEDIKNFIHQLGFTPLIAPDLTKENADPFSANALDYRAKSLINALTNEQSSMIWCLRGGYGASLLLPFLERLEKPKKSKLILGFSDITSLFLFLDTKWNMPSLHCKVLSQFLDKAKYEEKEITEITDIILGKNEQIEYDIIPLNNIAKNITSIESRIIGGNLSLIESSIGTFWEINTKDKIVFLEDTGERGYKIDRMLNHLEQAKILESTKAIIFADFTNSTEPNGTEMSDIAITRLYKKAKCPVFKIKDLGHGKLNKPIPIGVKTFINNNKIKFLF